MSEPSSADQPALKDEYPDDPPSGFVLATNRGPFSTHNGPSYRKETDAGLHHGMRVQKRHCNGAGIMHGGMLMAFADGLLGGAVWRETQTIGLTIRMNADFLSSARPREWLEGTARVVKATRSLAFCEAELHVGSRAVLSATGVFKLMERHRSRAR